MKHIASIILTALLFSAACLTLGALLFSCTKKDGPSDSISFVSEPSVSFPAGGGTTSVSFKASGQWTASISEEDASDWLSISPTAGDVSGSIFMAASANTDTKERSATVKITCGSASEEISVTQDPGEETSGGGTVKAQAFAELPIMDESNPDYYYNTLYSTTVNSGKRVRNFSFCYDKRRHNPIWVAYPMHSIYAEGTGRSKNELGGDPWMEYPDLARSEQSIIWDINGDGFMYWSTTSSIIAGGAWTKGHLCMSSSREGAGSELNLQTFYPVNIAPQANDYAGAGIFSSLWLKTENMHYKRGSQICNDTLYIVAGCHYANDDNVEYDACNWNTHSANSKACIMPTHQYKVLLRTKAGNTGKAVSECSASELKTIGFWFDSVPDVGSSEDLADYAVPVAEIEKITGQTFFPDIPKEAKEEFTLSFWGL